MRFPRFSPTGDRLLATTDIGTLYVLDGDGKTLATRDLGALGAPTWLPDGDIFVATWMGRVMRLGKDYQPVWSELVTPDLSSLAGQPTVPTTRIASWSNAVPESTLPGVSILTAAKTSNTQLHADISLYNGAEKRGIETAEPMSMLINGDPQPPAKPIVPWNTISWFGEGSAFNYILVDTAATPARYTGVTFIEDPEHPESWMRDAYIESWDAPSGTWTFIMPLLSSAATHTHAFPKLVDTTKLRIILQPGLVGNLRLQQIIFHGGPVPR